MRVSAGGLEALNEVLQRTHERLEESWHYARTIVETVRESLVVLDGELRVKAANRAFYQTFRVKPDDIENRFIYELGRGQWNIAQLREQLQQIILENSEFEDFKVTHEFPVIGRKTVLFSARRLHQVAKLRPLILLAVEDVSGRQQAEEVLAKSHDFYLRLFEEFPAMIWRSGLDARFNYFNKSWLSFAGKTLEQECGEDWAERVHPEELEACVRTYLHAFHNRLPFEMEHRLRRRDGAYCWVADSGRPYQDWEDNFAGFLGACYDITARKQADEKLRAIMEAVPDAIVVADKNLKIMLANAQTEATFGYTRAELLGESVERLIPERFRESHRRHLAGYLAAPKRRLMDQALELHALRRNGSEFPVEISLCPLTTDEGVFVSAVIRDITSQKLAEQALHQKEQQLRDLSLHLEEARERERSHLAREIHDELGQMLTALKMDVSWLQGKLPRDQQVLQQKTSAMVKLINTTMQAVQRIASELRPGVLDDLGLSAAIEWLAEQFRLRSNVAFEVLQQPEDLDLDRERSTTVFRILQEALTNVTRHAMATEVTISLFKRERKLLLTVRDNGKGITAAQSSASRSLGLLGMRERVQPWGGKVKIKGRPNRGTVVFVSLPLSE